jgi:anti-anti-sigma factor
MELHAEHLLEKSVIKINKKGFIGVENEIFQGLVQEAINKGSKNISVDVSSVDYISSWGIGGLVHAYTTCTNRDIRFNLTGANNSIKKILHQVKLDTLFNVS